MMLENKRIFILEDNVMNRIVYQVALKKHGAWVEFDRWGRETLDKIKRFRNVDLIILDLMLPGGESGYDVFQQIQEDTDLDAIPVIAVSASEPAVAIPRTQSLGFSGFIGKPIDEEIFPQQLVDVMDGKQIWQASNVI